MSLTRKGEHSQVKIGAAVTSTSKATTGTIKNETGRDAVIVAIEAMAYPTLETIVNSGGLVNLSNGGIDILPCEFYVNGVSGIDRGAVELKPHRIPCHLPFPKDSTVTIEYTPQDDQSQKLAITLFYDNNIAYNPKQHTYMKTGVGSAVTAVTIAANHVTIDVPAAKGGILRAIEIICWGVIEKVVNQGGLLELRNKSSEPSWTPCGFFMGGLTACVSGSAVIPVYRLPCKKDLPSVSQIQLDYTPQDNQSQKLSLTAIWTPYD